VDGVFISHATLRVRVAGWEVVLSPAHTRSFESFFLIVNGPPGSGKTTLATAHSGHLGLPLISKDTIKEALMTVLPVEDVDSSKLIGRAAIAAMLSVALESPTGAVLEANFHRTMAAADLTRLPGDAIEIFCTCPRELCLARYARRQAEHRVTSTQNERKRTFGTTP
jgi:adenylate kinase family enzyme